MTNKEKVWEYLQTLYILGQSVISLDSDKIKSIVQRFKNGEQNEKEEECEDDEILNMLKNLSADNAEHIDQNVINNGFYIICN